MVCVNGEPQFPRIHQMFDLKKNEKQLTNIEKQQNSNNNPVVSQTPEETFKLSQKSRRSSVENLQNKRPSHKILNAESKPSNESNSSQRNKDKHITFDIPEKDTESHQRNAIENLGANATPKRNRRSSIYDHH